jgi:hypothetical protein
MLHKLWALCWVSVFLGAQTGSVLADEENGRGGFFLSLEPMTKSVGLPDFVGQYATYDGKRTHHLTIDKDLNLVYGGELSAGYSFVGTDSLLGTRSQVQLMFGSLAGHVDFSETVTHSNLNYTSVDGSTIGAFVGAVEIETDANLDISEWKLGLRFTEEIPMSKRVVFSPYVDLGGFLNTVKIDGREFYAAWNDLAVIDHRLMTKGGGIRLGLNTDLQANDKVSFMFGGNAGLQYKRVNLDAHSCLDTNRGGIYETCDGDHSNVFVKDRSTRIEPIVGFQMGVNYKPTNWFSLSLNGGAEYDFAVPGYVPPVTHDRRPIYIDFRPEANFTAGLKADINF